MYGHQEVTTTDSEDKVNAAFVAIYVCWGVIGGLMPLFMWVLGMHMGFGGITLEDNGRWINGQWYDHFYYVAPKYGPSFPWPLVCGWAFTWLPGFLFLACCHQAARMIAKTRR